MFKLFITLNIRLWWRSIKSSEIAAIAFYSLFLMLVFSQVIGVALTLLFVPGLDAVQRAYPWLTNDVQTTIHIAFINGIWFSQLFFTKNTRLRLSDNRKLLALGMPLNTLAGYLNLTGFFHPMNLLFHAFWLIYLGLMTDHILQMVAVSLFVVVNYGLISLFKWKFKLLPGQNLKLVNSILLLIVISLLVFVPTVNLQQLISENSPAMNSLLFWLSFTPGSWIYEIPSISMPLILITIFTILAFVLNRHLYSQTQQALLTPVASSVDNSPVSRLKLFKKWLGIEGGKYLFTVWSHSYTKTQLLLTFFIPAIYIIIMNDGTTAGLFTVAMFLSFIPAFFLMLLFTNMFGFENRELLLSLQSPTPTDVILKERVYTALKVSFLGFFIAMCFVPLFFDTFIDVIQIWLAMIFVSQCVLHFVIKSAINNYKKIEDVGLMSVSNPVIPASITFICMFIILFMGLLSFFVIESYQWIHIITIFLLNIILAVYFIKKLNRIETLFKSKIIKHLWNEL